MQVQFGEMTDIDEWMKLVEEISWIFPGLETKEDLDEHRKTVLKFIKDHRALCIKDGIKVVGVLLFSRKHNMICFLGVSPQYRRCHIASKLVEAALDNLDGNRDITVSTFREEDEKGAAPRALYQKFGFEAAELTEEFGYPNQVFVLRR